MKKLFIVTILFVLLCAFPVTAMADVSVGVSISLPPIVFAGPPEVVVLPETNAVYVVPYIEVDLFFWNGWWWRPYRGGWYRSRYYDHGWAYYGGVPRFYYDVDPHWRSYYQHHDWQGHRWNYQPVPYPQLQRNWNTWQNNRYWERQKKWNVQDYAPKPQQQRQQVRQDRQREYQQRPEVQQHQKERQDQQRQQAREHQKPKQEQQRQQPQVHQREQQQHPPQVQHQGQPQPEHGQSRPPEEHHKGGSPHQERPEKGDGEHRK